MQYLLKMTTPQGHGENSRFWLTDDVLEQAYPGLYSVMQYAGFARVETDDPATIKITKESAGNLDRFREHEVEDYDFIRNELPVNPRWVMEQANEDNETARVAAGGR